MLTRWSNTASNAHTTKPVSSATSPTTGAQPTSKPKPTTLASIEVAPATLSLLGIDAKTEDPSAKKDPGEFNVAKLEIDMKRKHGDAVADKDKPKQTKRDEIVVMLRTPRGRAPLQLSLTDATTAKEHLTAFMKTHAFVAKDGQDPFEAVRLAAESGKAVVTLDRIVARQPLSVPNLGQSHELELDAELTRWDKGQLRPAEVVAVPKPDEGLFENHPALQIVAETLGKCDRRAVAEVVSGPYSNEVQLSRLLGTVSSLVRETEKKAAPLEDILAKTNEGKDTIRLESQLSVALATSEPDGVGVQTTRDIPIRDLSRTLVALEKALEPAQRHLVVSAEASTNEFMKKVGLLHVQRDKAWEAMHMFVWMAAAEAVQKTSETFRPSRKAAEEVKKDWGLWGGKGFFGVLPRFAPGDLLRGSILKQSDRDGLAEVFNSARGRRAMTEATMSTVDALIHAMSKSSKKGERGIAEELEKNRSVIQDRIHDMAVQAELVPGGNQARYPGEKKAYGAEVQMYKPAKKGEDLEPTPSLCFAGGQFPPGRKRTATGERRDDVPLSGAFEFRNDGLGANKDLERYFDVSTGAKLKAEIATRTWTDFAKFRDSVTHRDKDEPALGPVSATKSASATTRQRTDFTHMEES